MLDGLFLLNAIIENLDLRKTVLYGRQFTWPSRCEIPTYEKLDRVLTNIEWEQKFPLVTVCALTRTGSYHTPLIVDLGEPAHLGSKKCFSFELSCMRQDGFYEIVRDTWNAVHTKKISN
jgi:hypothetical protein